ncbi:SIR2 family protein [Cupriavidus necator]|uniref:SIR2 family protein n=1 Tax=Cupriavidus necator TaxID=106590 RepID=UPI003ECF6B1C
MPEVEAFIDRYVTELRSGTAAVFAGAGLSVNSGYVNWAELLRDIAAELGLDVDRETNLVAVAQYHFNERQNRSDINQKLVDEFSLGHKVNENQRILAQLPIHNYWTTNYDRMIEKALEENGKVVDRKFNVSHLKKTVRNRDAIVYKMHGDVEDPEHAVLTKDDYEGYFREREPFVTALAGDLVSKTFLFIGFSFTDPNIDYILSRIRVVLNKQPKTHYCFLRREARKPREKLADYEYRKRQQSFFVKDLARIGIRAVMVDEYPDITRILLAIEARYRSQTVFISGSAFDFDPWAPDDAADLIESLADRLIRKQLTLVSGFGLGVGPSVIAGALQTIQRQPQRYSRDQLQTFPFPVASTLRPQRERLYTAHREHIIEKAGIAIFLFGNNRDANGNVALAKGVREEFQIAKRMGLHIIAVGSTGWVAREISERMAADVRQRSKAFQKAHAVAANEDVSVEETVSAVMTMLDEYRKM